MTFCEARAFNVVSGGHHSRSAKRSALATVSLFAMLAAVSAVSAPQALAQVPQPQTAQAPAVEEIVVTGTRVVRDGYQAPTPLTVIGVEQLQRAAPENIADFVNQLPSLAGSSTPQNQQKGFSGLNYLNLRNLGSTRNLVLLDGQRSVGALLTGQVDVNNIPQALVSRVDIVTGGASAAYGSDAVSGVVNFVLDKTFTGIKGEVSGGVTTYGDDRSWKITLTGGTAFAGGRGHFLISGEVSDRAGVPTEDRAWAATGWKIVNNPQYSAANGQPRMLILPQVGLDTASPGGIITSGPLKGIEFGPGGIPRQFNYGSLVSDPYMQGGDWASTNADRQQSLDGAVNHQSVFTRAAYDVTDDINVFVQLSWDYTNAWQNTSQQTNSANIVLKADNAFIPASVAAQIAANKLTSITIGTMNGDLGMLGLRDPHTTNRYIVGGSGRFDAFGSSWNWDGYYQKGLTRFAYNGFGGDTLKSAFALALDAVRAPSGAIVCRSTLTNPTNGCVPYNPLGIGVNSQAAINYVTLAQNSLSTRTHRNEDYKQDVAAVNLRGEPFSDWAGPVSLATGIEHRRESVFGISSSDDKNNNFYVGNFLPNIGHYEVTEGYVETVIPLAKETVWAKTLDLNAAVRATGYSISGYVTTWKVGLTYAPIDDLHFRATRSRDIRAPNLSEFFQAGLVNTNNVNDPFNNNQSTAYQGIATGNQALQPEKADSTGIGVVVQPQFFPGFSASVDYYNIDINNAIGSVGAQDIVNFCFQGLQAFCSAITRGVNGTGANVITAIKTSPFNLVTQIARGLDIEASYHTRLDTIVSDWNGDLSLRFLATNYLKNYSNNGISAPTNTVGSNAGSGPPNWRYLATINYNNDPIDLALTARGLSGGTYNNAWVVCTTACPVSTTVNPTVASNTIEGALYFDLNASYKFMHRSDSGTDAEVFLNVRNLTNKDPAVVAQGPSLVNSVPANSTLYDTLGRVFRAGVRFRM